MPSTKNRTPIYYDDEGTPIYQATSYCEQCLRVDGVLEYPVEGKGWVRHCQQCDHIEHLTGD